MKALTVALLLGAGLGIAIAPEAEAHKRFTAPPVVHYDAHHHRGHMPAWLRRDRGFRSWYRHVHLHGQHRFGWRELYSIYRYDTARGGVHRFDRYGDRRYGRDYGDRRRDGRGRKPGRRHRD